MSLKTYRVKRDFKKTREPKPLRAKSKGFGFVVQRHQASHLHYDFRLELDGVLKSWAVPKEPAMDPKIKRLAVEVEDHPVSYADFEGQIPKGEYGAGYVEIWDRGTWEPLDRAPLKALAAGRLEFILNGQRLGGKWLLVRTKNQNSRQPQWLLIKRAAQYPQSDLPSGAAPVVSKAKASAAPLPGFVSPQLAELSPVPPDGDDWVHEIKYDGYRTLCRIDKDEVKLLTRNGHDWTARYQAVAQACRQLMVKSALLDGEIIAVDRNGKSDFGRLQEALESKRAQDLIYCVFDLLHLDGENLIPLPLIERKARLKKLFGGGNIKQIMFSEHWRSSGASALRSSCKHQLEGIVSKRQDAPYESGRGKSWIKSKCGHNEEFIVVGYTQPKGARTGLGALLLGAYSSEGRLEFVGRVGTGFSDRTLKSLLAELKPLSIKKSPLAGKTPAEKDIQWVKPQRLAQVKFAEWTSEGLLRHASFLGIREDKDPKQVGKPGRITKPAVNSRIGGVRLTHPNRVLFENDLITKQQIAQYYLENHQRILPYLINRPLSLLRCPRGVSEPCFFQKHQGDSQVESIFNRGFATRHSGGRREEVMYIDSVDGLLQLVQLGAVEIHLWGCHIPNIDCPDMIVFDLDPAPGVSWTQVIEAACQIRDQLEQLKLKSFLKVTGGKGLHLHIPIKPVYSWEEIKLFCRGIAQNLEQKEPARYTSQLPKAKRKGKIFIDYLRNGYGATAIAPYSLRARPDAPIAFPISWKELNPKLKPDQFRLVHINSILRSQKPDPWQHILDLRQTIRVLDDYKKLQAQSSRRRAK